MTFVGDVIFATSRSASNNCLRLARPELRETSAQLSESKASAMSLLACPSVMPVHSAFAPSVEKLQALAQGLGVPEEDIFRVARGLPLEEAENPTETALVTKFHRLSEGRQQEILIKPTL